MPVSLQQSKGCTNAGPYFEILYPDFTPSAKPFQLHTDASTTGIGVALEQSVHVIAYAGRALSKSEQNYSVIQKECLALVYALKQF